MSLHLLFLIGYSLLLIFLGLIIGRLVKTTGAFFVAGRQLGPVLLFSTLLAANIGAGSTVGAAGLGYRDGLSAWWWVGSAGIGSILLAFWVGPRMWRLAMRHDLRTVGDFLELRYSGSVRGIVAALLWIGTLAILAGQLIAISTILNVVAGVPRYVGCLIGGVVMTTYFTAGGLLTSAWVNAVQLVVILVGFAVALPMSLAAAGGWSAVMATEAATNPAYTNFWRGGGSGWIYVAMIVPAFIISPGVLQKTFGARDEKTVRIGVSATALVLLVFAFVPPLLGMIARVHHPELLNHENALAMVLVYELPLAVGMLGLAAVFSAELSSCDAILFMLSTSLSQDLYRRFVNPGASDSRVLKVARLAAVTGGALGVLLAIVVPTVIGALKIFYSVLSVSLFVPIVAGLHYRRAGTPEALAAVGVGVSVLLAVHLHTGGMGFGAWTPSLIGLIASGLGFAVVAVARGSPAGPAGPTEGAEGA